MAESKSDKHIPNLVMLVGLPASGKSLYADYIRKTFADIKLHSSDDLRIELFGDVNENSKESNSKLFTELHKRIKKDLGLGYDVIYDATNLNKKRRIAFLKEIGYIKCNKICVFLATPYEICLENNKNRERQVPENIIHNMYLRFEPPHTNEGFDKVIIQYVSTEFSTEKYLNHCFDCYKKYTLDNLFNPKNGIDNFNQDNKHHKLTLGDHCRKAARYIIENYPDDDGCLTYTALIHDIGKPFTKTKYNSKGIDDGNFHYYNHNNVGAYDSFFYSLLSGFDSEQKLYIANLIYYHMHPYTVWNNAKESKIESYKKQIGMKMWNDIWRLHKADEYAH